MGTIRASERPDAEQLLEICRSYLAQRGATAEARKTVTAREIAPLVERLARRSAAAIPFATLGRALLAQLSQDEKEALLLVEDFALKLSLLGL